ncbi:MAG: energy-coupling factor ABC transporter permease [Acidobacteriota bacterium]
MHIPDGFLSPPVWLSLDVVSVLALGYVARRAQRGMEETRIPLLGVMGAFVFAAQMINFPVGVGTSGHLVGAALLAITLGPAAAAVVMTAILAIQALVFQDGGILALGANVMNMALAGVLAGYLPYHYWSAGRLRKPAIVLGGLLSVAAGAGLAVAELLLSGVRMPAAVLGVSAALFLLTGVLEGLITLAVVQGVEALNPGMIRQPSRTRAAVLGALALAAVLLAVGGVLAASQAPDVLESLAERLGIAPQARALLATPLADYEAQVFSSPWLRKAAAGLVGLGLIYGACVALGRLAARRKRG